MEQTRIQQQIEELKQAIAAQEKLRGQLSNAVLDTTIATLQEKCANLRKALSQTTKERKWVTILFADVAGSTAMAETMDPEIWADIIDVAFKHFIQPVERCKGLVARLMGDAILAFFGTKKSHPEDSKLVVSAGLMMLQEMRPLRERVARDYDLDFQIRVGINTGEVLLGQFGTEDAGEFTAMGDAVNLASRLEHAAPPGHVLISKNTLDLLDDSFEIQPFQDIQFKGKSSAMSTFLVKGRRSSISTADTPILTPFVGREQELSLMQKIIRRACKKNSPQVLTCWARLAWVNLACLSKA
jgi:class 3 adenylate cyclase